MIKKTNKKNVKYCIVAQAFQRNGMSDTKEEQFIKKDIKKRNGGIDIIARDAEIFSLGTDDILRITDGKTNIIAYEDLEQVSNLDNIFKPYGAIIMLYQTAQAFGHWVCLLKTGEKTLEFYDSYGLKPDQELDMANDFHLRIHDGVITPHLMALMKAGGWSYTYNKERLQKRLEDINTCGRYCALRVRFRDISMSKFNKLLTDNKHYHPDLWVSVLTMMC